MHIPSCSNHHPMSSHVKALVEPDGCCPEPKRIQLDDRHHRSNFSNFHPPRLVPTIHVNSWCQRKINLIWNLLPDWTDKQRDTLKCWLNIDALNQGAKSGLTESRKGPRQWQTKAFFGWHLNKDTHTHIYIYIYRERERSKASKHYGIYRCSFPHQQLAILALPLLSSVTCIALRRLNACYMMLYELQTIWAVEETNYNIQ